MANSALPELLKMALKASDLAEKIILQHYQTDVAVDWKSDNTPVTIADQGAEEAVRQFLGKETPDFGFIGEEFGVENPEAEYSWVLDPIDGTKSFIHGVPLFGTLLALVHQGEPVVGLIRLPALGSTLWASQGAGAFRDGKRIHCSQVTELQQALVLSGTLNTMEDKGYGDWFKRCAVRPAYTEVGGDCYGYYMVACGRAEAMIDPVVSLWDVAPMPVIFAEAGGHFCSFSGESRLFDPSAQPLQAIHDGFTGLATNGLISIPLPDALTKV